MVRQWLISVVTSSGIFLAPFSDMDSLRLIGGSFLIMLVILNYFVGMHPLMETMYDYHLLPRPSVEEVRHVMMRRSEFDSMLCRVGENGWDYICDATSRSRVSGETQRYRFGAMGGFYPVVRTLVQLPLEGPIPSKDAYLAQQTAQAEHQRKQLALIDLNNAREDQLIALPGVSRDLARRIIVRAIEKPFATVDDLLTVEGVDRAMLERLRPSIRVSKRGRPLG